MAVSDTGEVLGSVSGGCVEGAVYELAQEVLASGCAVLARYGVSDNDAAAVGLTCGGTLEIFVAPVDADDDPRLSVTLASIAANQPVAVASVIVGGERLGRHLVVTAERTLGTVGDPRLDEQIAREATRLLAAGVTATIDVPSDHELRQLSVFVQSFQPAPKMLIFGANDYARAVSRIGKFLGFHVTVCDARPIFTTKDRFPDADDVVVKWPHVLLEEISIDERTVICVLTHDLKFELPLLERAVRTPASYIGVMGSRPTHQRRLDSLRAAGLGQLEIDRLSAPLGLDLGAHTPEETAVAIAAEIIALRSGGTGQRLTNGVQSIHHRRPDAERDPSDLRAVN